VKNYAPINIMPNKILVCLNSNLNDYDTITDIKNSVIFIEKN